jgi:hypothetical protein
MDFINQVKKLKEITKSPDVKALCESFLRGDQVSESELIASLNEHNSSTQSIEATNVIQDHFDSIRKEESQVSKKCADSLMESWGGLKERPSSNAGSYNGKIEADNALKTDSSKLFESIANLDSDDSSAMSFVTSQGVNNLGVLESISKIKSSSIYTYPKAKIVCEQYQNLIVNRGVKEYSLVHNFIAELDAFSWDDDAKEIVENLRTKSDSLAREIEIAKVLEAIKTSGSSSFYTELTETLNQWMVSESKSNGLLVKNISQWSFNPVVRNLINFLNVNESQDSRRLEIPVIANGESQVSRVYSPVIFEGGSTLFYLNGSIFEATSKELGKVPASVVSNLPAEYNALLEAFKKPYVKVNENGISVQLGKKIVRLIEENDGVAVYLGKDKLRFGDNNGLAKLLGFESSAYYGVSESESISTIMTLYRNYDNIVELDFAKSITSNIYEGVSINLFKWNEQIYLQKVNEGMRENSLFRVSGSQAVSLVKDYMRYDISEGLTEFLDGESRVKSVMINDRNKVLENINKVENEISKISSLMESDPLYKSSKEIASAYSMLENELIVLREKWNQINNEIKKSDSHIELERVPELLEDDKFNIGNYVKIKESGDTGKIISIDSNSGRYTVLTDNGKTADYYVNEMSDLEEAINKAADANADTNPESSKDDSNEDGEVKEANNFNKSDLSITDQKAMLKKLAGMHGFSNAPKNETNEEIEMGMDNVHGYNLTMNEAKKLKDQHLSKAPGTAKKTAGKTIKNDGLQGAHGTATKSKGKVLGGQHLETSLDPKEPKVKTAKKDVHTLADAPGDSELSAGKVAGKKNLRVAPGNDSKVKGKTPGADKLADAPGKQARVLSFEAHNAKEKVKKIGYNLKESEDMDAVKKN